MRDSLFLEHGNEWRKHDPYSGKFFGAAASEGEESFLRLVQSLDPDIGTSDAPEHSVLCNPIVKQVLDSTFSGRPLGVH
jgi:hypothetical protein